MIYQIQTKFRDEARPRAGILRGREFVMKDSYSFDVDDAGLERSYQRHRDAYITTFDRLGLEFVIVSAMSGAMGGSASEEFLAPTEVGEDSFVRCAACDYAANVEAVTTPVPAAARLRRACPPRTPRTLPTPRRSTRSSTVSNARPDLARGDRAWTGADTLKNVVFMVTDPDGTRRPLAIGLPGDREVDMKRLEAVLQPSEAGPFEEADFAKHPSAGQGLHRPAAAGGGRRVRHPLPRRPAGRRRHPLDHRRQRARPARLRPGRRPRLHRRRRHRRGRGARRATSARRAAARSAWPAASRSATSSSSAASTPTPSA